MTAFFIDSSVEFIALGVLVGYVMGGTQSLFRSTYARMINADEGMDNTYFSLYDFTERAAMIIGLFGFGFIEQLTHSMRSSIAMLAAFFIFSILMLQLLKKTDLT
jgi:UMF1 family MFS transporter